MAPYSRDGSRVRPDLDASVIVRKRSVGSISDPGIAPQSFDLSCA